MARLTKKQKEQIASEEQRARRMRTMANIRFYEALGAEAALRGDYVEMFSAVQRRELLVRDYWGEGSN